MVQTRSMRRTRKQLKKPSSSAKHSYRRKVKSSRCRGAGAYKCVTLGCKVAKGRKRTFCRKKKNTRRRHGLK